MPFNHEHQKETATSLKSREARAIDALREAIGKEDTLIQKPLDQLPTVKQRPLAGLPREEKVLFLKQKQEAEMSKEKLDINLPLWSEHKKIQPERYEQVLSEAEDALQGKKPEEIADLIYQNKIDRSILERLKEEYVLERGVPGNLDKVLKKVDRILNPKEPVLKKMWSRLTTVLGPKKPKTEPEIKIRESFSKKEIALDQPLMSLMKEARPEEYELILKKAEHELAGKKYKKIETMVYGEFKQVDWMVLYNLNNEYASGRKIPAEFDIEALKKIIQRGKI